MNLSGKHFEYAGVYSSNPLGDDSVSLIFAHIDTKMFDSLFGAPEYSSAYSGSFGRRVLTGTNRSESCFEFEQEIVSEKGGIPLNKLRTIEQWLFSQETYCKLYIAEDEEDPEDVSYADGKKRLYLNCMFTEPQMLTYSEGKVGWKVKVVCDAPWAWQDEQTVDCYYGNSHACKVTLKNSGFKNSDLEPFAYVSYGTNNYYQTNDTFYVPYGEHISFHLWCGNSDPTKNGYYVNDGGLFPADSSTHQVEYLVTSDIEITFRATVGGHAYVDIATTARSETDTGWYCAASMGSSAPYVWGNYYRIQDNAFIRVNSYNDWVSAGRPRLYIRSTGGAISVVIDSDINTYIYPDSVDIYMNPHTGDTSVGIANATDDINRETMFVVPVEINRISISNNGTITNGSDKSSNLFVYMTERNFPRLTSSFSAPSQGVIGGLSGTNYIRTVGSEHIGRIVFTFKNRRFLA